MVGLDLVNEPDLASDPEHAAAIFAAFIGTRQTMIRTALAKGDLETARKAVNGGHNGMDNFRPAYVAGEKMLASMAQSPETAQRSVIRHLD